ncbi:MAG: bifunctional methylenetetrahydrofolate dehydrogenase/methenyltetrahydrofolate cyclohydrolase FolD [Clostridia bacterium]|nr:bifunctional methylenetetrahydrofolate dehydrogenase/methenyltetrahydrofolate cyclohydrolase FolD [Clostridia bacterium]
MAKIIDGKAVSAKVRGELCEKTVSFKEKYGYAPGLAVIIVGDDPASKIYVRNKKKACEEIGYNSFEYALPAETSEEELLNLIEKLNADDAVHGILVQSPVPRHIDEKKIQSTILPSKDVDAFHPINVGKIMIGDYDFVPCTPAGITELLDAYGIETAGKSCVVIGRSNIVGKPMAMLMLHKNCTVTICHSRTPDVGAVTREADIVIAAVGKSDFLTGDMIKEGAVVIDVGMNRNAEGKLCGDADFEACEKKASYITPVPGGVGPMTITMLMKNTLRSAELSEENK